MITFETLQECQDLNDLLPYILEVMFDDFVKFISQNGCAALTEEELVEFDELVKVIYDPKVENVDKEVIDLFNDLTDKAAWDPNTRHVYALATRLYGSTEPVETADIEQMDLLDEEKKMTGPSDDVPSDEEAQMLDELDGEDEARRVASARSLS